ncbi:hypothetical protein [Methylocystis sp. ATCC 49242]|uniref:hypothetical protein n=1 Tax=Methylocystis sp. ATCC 49242 TaxID=622637 RepID=UPI0001F87C7F|nr:hypothetical protein [Methylocystis sp. ATCC 49242]
MTRRPPLTRDLTASLAFRLAVVERVVAHLPSDAGNALIVARARQFARELLATFAQPDPDTMLELQKAVMTVVEEEMR